MIKEQKYTRYTPSCEKCGWIGLSSNREVSAERDLERHPCGKHHEAHGSGSYRGILGGYNRICICGSKYVSDVSDKFSCPRAR